MVPCSNVISTYMESHATPSIGQHTEIHVCERSDLSFTRRDNLQRHARTTCCLNVKTTYKRCGRAFATRDRLKRHDRRCNDKPPVPKLSRPATTTERIPLVEDTVVLPSRLPTTCRPISKTSFASTGPPNAHPWHEDPYRPGTITD